MGLEEKNRVQCLFNDGLACHAAGKLDEAVALYFQVLEDDPANPEACFYLGVICAGQGKLQEAISLYQKALEVEPDHFQVLSHLANAYRDEGLVEEAVENYRKLMNIDPDHVDTRLNLGIAYYQDEKFDEASSCYEDILKVDPQCQQAFYNLGLARYCQGKYKEAKIAYEASLGLLSDDVDSMFNLGLTCQKLNMCADAAVWYKNALQFTPSDAELHNCLGTAYKGLYSLEEAEACFRRAVELESTYGAAWANLGTVLHIKGELEEAKSAYEKAVELGHNSVAAGFVLAALSGETADNAPKEYVAQLFDHYADEFDHALTNKLDYGVPKQLKEVFVEVFPEVKPFRRVLDLGCGTGLSGEAFRDLAENLVGVDLSEAMISKAREKEIYDHLEAADLVEFLSSSDEEYDFVVAADVLIYIGELGPAFHVIANKMTNNGFLVFSTERLEDKDGFALTQSCRYAYSPRYIESVARENGFSIILRRAANLRKEKGQWITGDLFVLQKGASQAEEGRGLLNQPCNA